MALVLIIVYCFFYAKACVKVDYYTSSEYNHDIFEDEVYLPLARGVWISFVLLGIIFFTVGCLMLRRLRLYFKDFYQ